MRALEELVRRVDHHAKDSIEEYVNIHYEILTRKLTWLSLGCDPHIPNEFIYANFQYFSDLAWSWYATAMEFDGETEEGEKLVTQFYPLLITEESKEKCAKLVEATGWFASRLLKERMLLLKEFLTLKRIKGLEEDRWEMQKVIQFSNDDEFSDDEGISERERTTRMESRESRIEREKERRREKATEKELHFL